MVRNRLIAAAFALGLCVAFPWTVQAQTTSGTAPPDGAALFKQQCGACHSVTAGDPARQGPNLAGVVGRKPGSVEGFHYSPGFAKTDFTWDESHLDAYLTNPQAVIQGAI